MDLELLEQVAGPVRPCAALEKNVIRDHDCATAIDLEQALDVLEEIQLLVLGGGPEILPLVGLVLLLKLSLRPITRETAGV